MNAPPVDVVVLMGGPDAERPVSIQSGTAFADALRKNPRFAVRAITIERPDASELQAVCTGADVVAPLLHGPWGEGGPLQVLLEDIGIPYVGSGPAAAQLAMDKQRTKDIFRQHGIRTPDAALLEPDDPCPLALPLVLKPNDDGSSVDLVICHTDKAVRDGRAVLHPRRGAILAESYISGRELTVGIVGESTLPPIEIVPADATYDYAAKYERSDTTYRIEPDDVPYLDQCIHAAEAAARAVNVRDLARVDFLVDEFGAWCLEVNTMPGFTDHSLVPMAAAARGLDMTALCTRLVDFAVLRSDSARKFVDAPPPLPIHSR